MEQVNQERVFYQDESVFISNSRLVVKGRTFSLSNIVSVGLEEERPNNARYLGLGLVGLTLVGFGIGQGSAILLVVGLVAMLVTAYLAYKTKRQNVLKIYTNGSDFETALSDDSQYSNMVLNQINQAIGFRSQV